MASRRLSRSAAVTSTVSVARVSHSGFSARTRSEMRDAKRTLSLAARASITGASESGRSLQMLPKPRQALLSAVPMPSSISPVHFGPPHPALSTPSCANACVRS